MLRGILLTSFEVAEGVYPVFTPVIHRESPRIFNYLQKGLLWNVPRGGRPAQIAPEVLTDC